MRKKYTVAIAGTGYVGLSNAILLAQHNRVFALDIVEEKINMINAGKSPIVDQEIEEYLANEKAKAGYPQNYEIYIKSAINQPAGTSTYIANNTWKSTSYDAYSAYLLDSVEEDRWSVDKFLDEVRAKINSIL